MFELKVIPHSGVTIAILDEIIRIKSLAWPYSYEEQLKWINQNLKGTDLHFLLFKKSKVVAYLNLIAVELTINNDSYNAFGVGNVCACKKGEGLGNELMNRTNQYLLNDNKIGLLFCKQELFNFYVKYDWKTIEKPSFKFSFNNDSIEAMILNYDSPIQQIIYNGQSF
jgi:predicted GNAT family N-acyltransferase